MYAGKIVILPVWGWVFFNVELYLQRIAKISGARRN